MASRTPKYEEIKRWLRGEIESGRLSQGDRVPSEYALVDQLGVGRSQARQALRELELEGYVVRRQGSGSFVAPNAGGGPVQVSEAPATVAVAFPTYDSRYMRDVVEAFMARLFDAGYGVTNYNLQLDEEGETRFLDSVHRSGMAGLLIWLGNETPKVRDRLRELQEERFPLVMVDRYFPDVDLDYVVSDNERIGFDLTRALLDRGHERVACVGIADDKATSQANRLAGFQRARAGAGLANDDSAYVELDFLAGNVEVPIDVAMAPKEHPTGFVCINDIIADAVGTRLRQLGYSVGANVEVAAVDDGMFPGAEPLPAVTVRQQGLEIGRRSAERVLARLDGDDTPARHIIVEPDAVEASLLTPRDALVAPDLVSRPGLNGATHSHRPRAGRPTGRPAAPPG